MKREQFSSSLGFILAAAGSAVGIGNLVAFPVMASKNGGAAFLIMYAIFVFFICLPVMLAEMKARRISGRAGRVPVLGCDQMLVADGRWFDKPASREDARATLEALSGRRHELISAAVVTIDGARVWHAIGRARLTMRPLSPAFIEHYLDRAGEVVLGSVGAYQLEGLGAQLFSKVEGDYFTILGLPLIELLDFLRLRGVIPS